MAIIIKYTFYTPHRNGRGAPEPDAEQLIRGVITYLLLYSAVRIVISYYDDSTKYAYKYWCRHPSVHRATHLVDT